MRAELPALPASPPIEVWGGIECTVNRVGGAYFDQLERTGHAQRDGDLDLVASLGIRALRFPILWERVAPEGLASADWTWSDGRMERLRELGVEPVVGLVHHGSGPQYTDLLDPAFPEKLAEYAATVARRYPWVRRFTPVNEPLTTARFSGLYGHWYPHERSNGAFLRALVNECRGIVLAMEAIRQETPEAELVQTEDYAAVTGSPAIGYQAEFENERRWLSLDLLCGVVDQRHPLWSWLIDAGATSAELLWFSGQPHRPEVLGLNYYLTSERFLDEDWRSYPDHLHATNGRSRYADVEAVRVEGAELRGHTRLLQEAWERYGQPVAITEAHLGCTREEQMRWLVECWAGACDARERGVQVVAMTAWALFGLVDWHCLLTRAEGIYEPGVFDARAEPPRPTALAEVVRALATEGTYDHPVLAQDGWWRRPDRFLFPTANARGGA